MSCRRPWHALYIPFTFTTRLGSPRWGLRTWLALAICVPATSAFADGALAPTGAAPETLTSRGVARAAWRIQGGVPLGLTLAGPGSLSGELFLELPARGRVSGTIEAAVTLDGRPVSQVKLRRRRGKGRLTAGRVASSPSALHVEIPDGTHALAVRLPAGTDGGAVLEWSAQLPPLAVLAPVGLAPSDRLGGMPARTVEAFAPVALAPSEPAAAAAAPIPDAAGGRKVIRVAARVGTIVPSSELSPGGAAGVDVSWILPVGRGVAALDQKLRIALGVGDGILHEQGGKILPGRGYDPGFAEYADVQPIDLSIVYTLPLGWRHERIYLGAGYALELVQAQFLNFGRSQSTGATSSAALFQAGLEVDLGPGAVVFEARQTVAAADLGPLGNVGTDTLSGTTLAVGYAYAF